MNTINNKECRLCKNKSLVMSIDLGNQPIVHNLTNRLNNKNITYPFTIGICEDCGFIQLIDIIPVRHEGSSIS